MRSPFFSSLGHGLGLSLMGMLTLSSTPGVAASEPQLIPLIPPSGTIAQSPVLGSAVFRSAGSHASGLNLAQLDLLDLPQFYSVPRLIYTGTNRDWAQAYRPTYYFTLLFPPSEGAALGAVDLMQSKVYLFPSFPKKRSPLGGLGGIGRSRCP